MTWSLITRLFKRVPATLDAGPADPSRRGLLVGIACAGAAVVVGSTLIKASPASAASSGPDKAPGADEDGVPDDEVRLAQRRDRDDDFDSRGRDRRGRDRDRRGGGRNRRDRRGRRFRRRDIARRCERDRRFRRENRGLCRRLSGGFRPRRGSCVQIGPITLCE